MTIATDDDDFSRDLLRGARAIAAFLFGDPGLYRRVFYLVEKGRLPVFSMGSAGICARKSTLMKFFEEQESRCKKRTEQ